MNSAKKNLFVLAVLFLITTTAFCDDADDLIMSGVAKFTKGDYDGAIAEFTKAIQLKPDDADAYCDRGYARQNKDDLDGAIADYNKAIQLKPDFALAYNNRGNAKEDKGDHDGAIIDYNKAIELKQDYALAYNNRGVAKNNNGDYGEALTDCTRAIELKPDYAPAYNNRGIVYYNLRSFTNALVNFRKASQLNSSDDYPRFRLWLAQTQLGEREAATRELQQYLDSRKTGKPDDWPSNVGAFLAGRLTEANFFAAAKSTDKKVDNEQHCEAYFFAGSKRLIDGDKAAAMNYFDKCLATNIKSFVEYQCAAAELRFLKAAKER